MTSQTSTPLAKLIDTPRQPGSEPFQEAALKGVFAIPRCTSCQQSHWYPRPICPRCFSDDIEWEATNGMGEVYSYTVMRRAKPAYAIAYVRLDSGPVVMTNLVNCEFDDMHIGMRVRAVFQADESGTMVPLFEPVS